MYQAGTLSGHPLAMAAGIATLDALEPDDYLRLEDDRRPAARRGSRRPIAATGRRRHRVPRRVAADALLPRSRAGRRRRRARRRTASAFATLLRRDARAGVLLPPSPFEAWFLSLAHDRRRDRRDRSRPRARRWPRSRRMSRAAAGRPLPARVRAPAGRRDAGLVHAPGRTHAARVPRDPRDARRSSRSSATPPCAPRSRSSRCAGSASTPRSSSPTSPRRCAGSASASGSWTASARSSTRPIRTDADVERLRAFEPRSRSGRCSRRSACSAPSWRRRRRAAHRLRRRAVHARELPRRGTREPVGDPAPKR